MYQLYFLGKNAVLSGFFLRGPLDLEAGCKNAIIVFFFMPKVISP